MASGGLIAASSNAEEAEQIRIATRMSLGELGTIEDIGFKPAVRRLHDRGDVLQRAYEHIENFKHDIGDRYIFVRASGNGNCLFNAISFQYYGDEGEADNLRRHALDLIEDDNLNFTEDGLDMEPADNNKAGYIRRLRTNGTYGGYPEIRALAIVMEMPFVVYSYSEDNDQMSVFTFGEEYIGTKPPITLLHGGVYLHYDSLLLQNVNYPLFNATNSTYTFTQSSAQQAWDVTNSLRIPLQQTMDRLAAEATERRARAAAIAAVAAATAATAPGGGGPPKVTVATSAPPPPPANPVDDIAVSLATSLLFQAAALVADTNLVPLAPPLTPTSGTGGGTMTVRLPATPIPAPPPMPPGAAAAAAASGTGAAVAAKPSDEVFVFVTYTNNLLFYINTPGGKLAVPHGPMVATDKGPAGAALRILNTYITGHGLTDTSLIEFHTVKTKKNKLYYFYCIIPMPAATTSATATGAGPVTTAIVPSKTSVIPAILPGTGTATASPIKLFTNAGSLPTDVDATFAGILKGLGGSSPGSTTVPTPAVTATSTATTKAPAPLHIVSYNILTDFFSKNHVNTAVWSSNRIHLMIQKLTSQIKKGSIICLQEVSDDLDKHFRALLFTKASGYIYERVAWGSKTPGGPNIFGVAIAFPNAGYKLTPGKAITSPEPSAPTKPNRILNISLTSVATGAPFCVSTYHMPIEFSKTTKNVIDHAAMVPHMNAAATAAMNYAGKMPYIFCGDFNIRPFIQDKSSDPQTKNPAYEQLFNAPFAFRSAYKVINKAEPLLTTISQKMVMDKTTGKLVSDSKGKPTLEPEFRGTLDYILISKEWNVTGVDAPTAISHPIPDLNEPSDHLMIGATLSLGSTTGPSGAAAGVVAVAATPTVSGSRAASLPFMDAGIMALRAWIVTADGTPYKTRTMVAMLKKLAEALGIPFPAGMSERDLIDLPLWARDLFDINDIKDRCFNQHIITRDCSPLQVLHDILIADEFAHEYRIMDGDNDAQRIYYEELLAKLRAPGVSPADRVDIQKLIEKKFYSKVLHIKQDSPGPATTWSPPPPLAQYKRRIPNPYRARAYRNKVSTWGDPTVVGSEAEKDYNKLAPFQKPMYLQNLDILQPLVQPEIWKNSTKDKDMTIAVLESLWHCGQNPTMDGKSTCFPAQVIAELREYQNKRLQQSQSDHAKKVLGNGDWPFLIGMLNIIKGVIGPSRISKKLVKPGGGGGGGPPAPRGTAPPGSGPSGRGPIFNPLVTFAPLPPPPRPPFTPIVPFAFPPPPGGGPRPPVTRLPLPLPPGTRSTFPPAGGLPFTFPPPAVTPRPSGLPFTFPPAVTRQPAPRPPAGTPRPVAWTAATPAPTPASRRGTSTHIMPLGMLGGYQPVLPGRTLGGVGVLPPIRRRIR